MNSTQRPWLATADGRGATLYLCTRTEGGGLHLEEKGSLRNAHESEHEHGRPAMLGGSERQSTSGASVGHAAPHLAAPGHDAEEALRRFSREIRTWLGHTTRQLGVTSLNIFAPPRLLGLLRNDLQGIAATVELHEAELMHLRAGELASHPAIRSAVGAATGGGTHR